MADRIRLGLAGLLLLPFLAVAGQAHHGWRWAEQDNSTLEGTIVDVRLGNPHGVVTVQTAEGEAWQIEVGQPWRNEAAGLAPEVLRPGSVMQVQGHRSAEPNQRLMKAERVSIGGTTYNLYPDRN
jgi:hypothetical protein